MSIYNQKTGYIYELIQIQQENLIDLVHLLPLIPKRTNTIVMKKVLLTFVFSLIFAITGFCSITIAVLPYTVRYEGRIPKKMTPELIISGQIEDGTKYQTSIINYLTRMSNKKKYAYLDINVLGQVQIDAMLFKHGIDAAVTTLTNAQLAEALGVTHVVRGNVTRNFIMSDEASLALGVMNVFSNQRVNNITSTINIINSMENMATNRATYSQQRLLSTKATRNDVRALRSTFRQSARRMGRKIYRDSK